MMVDNFYDFAFKHRERFDESESICKLDEEFTAKIEHLVGQKIKILQCSNEKLIKNEFDVKSDINSDLTAIVCLTLPPYCINKKGLKFFNHKKLGTDEFPNNGDAMINGWNRLEDIEKSINFKNKNEWVEYGNFFVKYNRLILFRSNLWHSFGSGFGKDTDDCMLFQKIKIGYA